MIYLMSSNDQVVWLLSHFIVVMNLQLFESNVWYDSNMCHSPEEFHLNWPLTCGGRIDSVQHSKYHGCWCPGQKRPNVWPKYFPNYLSNLEGIWHQNFRCSRSWWPFNAGWTTGVVLCPFVVYTVRNIVQYMYMSMIEGSIWSQLTEVTTHGW